MKDGGGSRAATTKPDASVLFRELFMHMAEGVALHELAVDGAGRPAGYRIVEVNPQYEQFMGMTRDRLIGKLASEVFGPGDPRGLDVYSEAVLVDRHIRLETSCPVTGRHFEISVSPMGSGFFATIMVDVTARKTQEKALREGEWFLQRSQRVGRLGSYSLDVPADRWVSSQGLDDVFGIDAGFTRDVAGWTSLVHVDDRDLMSRYFAEEVLGKRKPFDYRYRIIRRNDGAVRWVHGRGELELDASGAPVSMIGTIQDITEEVQREQALRSKSDELDRVFSLTLDMLCIASPDGQLLRVNAAWERVLGWPIEELEGAQLLDFVHADEVAATREAMRDLARGKDLIDFTNRCRCQDGSYRFMEWRSVLAGGVIYAAARDVSERQRSQAERQRLEQQLLQSQKMESVGLLAGGVAHDFNNLLTVILGCTDDLGVHVGHSPEPRELLSEITLASQRAADLTRQLLAFSRRQVLQPRALDLNTVVADVSRMLGRMLGETVKLELLLDVGAGGPVAVFADPGQLQQIIVNLAVNARDAMPKGGTLTLQTADLGPAEAAGLAGQVNGQNGAAELGPGAYVMLLVRDTGLGMDEVTRARIFEPFFTTKGEMGTGLGLATVYGIVKQSGGQILVSSEPGQGTTFKVFLPRAQAGLATFAPTAHPLRVTAGRETVLLVEDEGLVRTVLKKALVGAGYRVLEAANAEEASLVHEQAGGAIAALVTDVVMPGRTGLELARQLTASQPALKVLYMSGYAPNAPELAFGAARGVAFLQKPLTPPQLLSTLRDVLDCR